MMKVLFGPSFFKKLYWICYNIASVLCLFVCFSFFWPRGFWDLSSPHRDQTHNPCIGRRGLNRWTVREVPVPQFFLLGIYPEVELPSHMMILFLILKESSYSFPQWLYHFIFPLRMQIYFCFIDYAKAFDCVDHKLWKILKEMGISDHLTCLLRNLYAGQEATVRTGHGKTDWFQIGKGVRQGCILSPCLFNFYAEYIMRNAGLEETQAGIKIARRNINNLRYADDTTLMAEHEEELKSLLMKVKEEEKKLA